MKRTVLSLSVVAGLSACATAEITQPPIAVTPVNAGAVGVDVYARERSRGNPVPRFRGQDTVEVRTFGNLDGNGYTEIVGVGCSLDSGLYQAQFQTPANLVVPDYGPNSPAIFVRCVTDAASGSSTVNTVNQTAQQRQAGAAGAGLLGALVIGAVNAAVTDPQTDEFGYPMIRVNLE